MNDYTKALHQRFYREPENTEEEQAMEQAEQALKAILDREQRKLLLALVNAQSLCRSALPWRVSQPASAWGWASQGELEPYSFDYDQEERARQKIELEVD